MELTKNNIENRFTRYVLPSVLTQLLIGLYTVVDGLFIGRYAGDAGLAAVNLSWPVAAIIYATASGISTGGSVLIGNRMGAGKPLEAARARGNAIAMLAISALFFSLLFTLLLPVLLTVLGAQGEVRTAAREYLQIIIAGCIIPVVASGLAPILRNYGRTVSVMILMMICGFLNVCLDGFFVGVLHWGARGAAVATLISQSVCLAVSVVFLLRINDNPVHLSEFRLLWNDVKSILSIGMSPFGLYVASSITLLFTNWQCLRYGGNEALAAYAVAAYVTGATGALLSGVGDGIQPLVSFAEGAGDHSAAMRVFHRAIRVSLSISGVIAVLSILSRDLLARLFGCGPEAAVLLNTALIFTPLAYPLMGLCKLSSSYLYADGNHRFSSILIYLDPLVVSPVMLLIVPALMQVTGIWISYPATYVFMLALTALLIHLHEKKQSGI